jgi:putative intracellular protease/amidase
MRTLNILIPLPSTDFDPTEAALSWKILRDAGHAIHFATPDGRRAHADPLMLSGRGLDPWGWIPGLNRLRLIGLLLRADRCGRQAYRAMERDARFLQPARYDQLRVGDYDGLLLPGGHAQGMKAYLENRALQDFVAAYFDHTDAQGRHRPVAAVCHGVVLAARSVSKVTGKSVLHGRKTTALTWRLEKSAWNLGRFFARFWDPGYYRTYREAGGEPAGYRGVEQEIKRALASASDFLDVPRRAPHHFRKTSGLVRDRVGDDRAAWVVRDGNYLSARWPGDVHSFAGQFAAMLNEHYAP